MTWEPLCVSVKTAAVMTDKSEWVIYQAIKGGDLNAHRPTTWAGRGDMVIFVEDLKAWIRGEKPAELSDENKTIQAEVADELEAEPEKEKPAKPIKRTATQKGR